MPDFATLANVVATVVGTITIAGAAKSIYNGSIRSVINHISMIPEVAQKVDDLSDCVGDVKDEQEEMKEGMVALAEATSRPGREVPAEEMAHELGVEPGIDRFYSDGDWSADD